MEETQTAPQVTYKDVLYMHQAEIDKVRDKLHNTINEITTLKLDIVKINDKLGNPKPCDLHVSSMKELNDGITRIELVNSNNSSKLDGFMILATKLIEKMDNDIYKEGGLMSKVTTSKNQIGLIWGIISAIFVAGGVMFLWKR